LTKIIIKEENFKLHLEAFASELFVYYLHSYSKKNANIRKCKHTSVDKYV